MQTPTEKLALVVPSLLYTEPKQAGVMITG